MGNVGTFGGGKVPDWSFFPIGFERKSWFCFENSLESDGGKQVGKQKGVRPCLTPLSGK
jgi:hypothetical protein